MAKSQSTTSDLVPFQFHDTTLSAITDANGVPWFVAADVCAILEIKNVSDALSRLKPHEKAIVLNDTPGGKQDMLIINESGFYKFVLRSRKKIAEEFQCWVTEKVLPQIRKTGKYEEPGRALTPAQMFLAQAQINVEFEQRQAAIEARQDEQALQIAALADRQPPEGKLRIEDWLRRQSKPFLPKLVLTHLRAICRDMEDPEMFRPENYDYLCPYYSSYTIAVAYEQATRQLSFFSREASLAYHR